MKSLLLLAIPLMVSGLVLAEKPASPDASAVVSNPGEPAAPVTLDELLNPPSHATTGVTDLRSQMLTDAGKTVGFRGGMTARARVLVAALDGRAAALDPVVQFAPLINRDGTIPPVIVEARDLSAFAPDQVRTASRVYKIVKEEHFVSVPPTWRDYLLVGLPVRGAVELPVMETRPQDDKEQGIWKAAVNAGWIDGQHQADAILAANFNRLARDYTGMLRYSTLLQAGMITPAHVAESRQTVTGNTTQLMLGDTLRRLTSHATFETDPLHWEPTVNKVSRQPVSPPRVKPPVLQASAVTAVKTLPHDASGPAGARQ